MTNYDSANAAHPCYRYIAVTPVILSLHRGRAPAAPMECRAARNGILHWRLGWQLGCGTVTQRVGSDVVALRAGYDADINHVDSW